jgi:hypothetical protein
MKSKRNFCQLMIFSVFLLFFSCDKDHMSDNTCNVSNPLKELEWLKSTIQNIEQLSPDASKYYYISMAKYNGETVFIEGNCDPLANSVLPVLSCNGEQLGVLGEINPDSLTDRKVIWKTANSVCYN